MKTSKKYVFIIVSFLLLFSMLFSSCEQFVIVGNIEKTGKTTTEKQTDATEELKGSEFTVDTDFDALESDKVTEEELFEIFFDFSCIATSVDSYMFRTGDTLVAQNDLFLGKRKTNFTVSLDGKFRTALLKYDGSENAYVHSLSISYSDETGLSDQEYYGCSSYDLADIMVCGKVGEVLVQTLHTESLESTYNEWKKSEFELTQEILNFFEYNEERHRYELIEEVAAQYNAGKTEEEKGEWFFKIKNGMLVYMVRSFENDQMPVPLTYRRYDCGTTNVDPPEVVKSQFNYILKKAERDADLKNMESDQVTVDVLREAILEVTKQGDYFNQASNVTIETRNYVDGKLDHVYMVKRDGLKVYTYDWNSAYPTVFINYYVIADDLNSFRRYDRNGELKGIETIFLEQIEAELAPVKQDIQNTEFSYDEGRKGYECVSEGLHLFLKIKDGHVVYAYGEDVLSGRKYGEVIIYDFGTTTVVLPESIR